MMAMIALGAFSATHCARSRTMDAFVLNRSSRVMPGLRGTPAGITTTSAPADQRTNPVCTLFKITFDGVGELFRALVSADLGRGVHVGKVDRDARSHGRQVIQSQPGHQGVLLYE
ncbi:hypothetical protein MSG28_005554 [Choristoneura fumiferana]|uniref:Uncharacterized protein n=1 Tax=Choristoneura fumiferana TaxID=7141 RepID=A0ACC0KZV9_CHOFU|nr:hypothetical protein MSG28_005554 [Choristoneura fumiferana]